MAIQHDYTSASGIILPQAYHRVMSSNLQHKNTADSMVGMVSIYKDATSRVQGLAPVQTFQFEVTGGDCSGFFGIPVLDQTNVNTLSQTYMWMKTQNNLNGIDYSSGSIDI